MKFLAVTALSIVALSLTSCATYAPHAADETPQKVSSSDMLLSGISADKITLDGISPNKLSAENPTCLKLYANTVSYMSRPQGAARAKGFGKTLALGLLAGAASGGVASLGIGSGFLEAALAGTANQVAFQGGKTALDKVAGGDSEEDKIGMAASQLGCPKPDMAAMKASKKAAKALKKSKKDE